MILNINKSSCKGSSSKSLVVNPRSCATLARIFLPIFKSILEPNRVNVVCLQELFHPIELQSMVTGNEDYDWDEMKKVSEEINKCQRTVCILYWNFYFEKVLSQILCLASCGGQGGWSEVFVYCDLLIIVPLTCHASTDTDVHESCWSTPPHLHLSFHGSFAKLRRRTHERWMLTFLYAYVREERDAQWCTEDMRQRQESTLSAFIYRVYSMTIALRSCVFPCIVHLDVFVCLYQQNHLGGLYLGKHSISMQ